MWVSVELLLSYYEASTYSAGFMFDSLFDKYVSLWVDIVVVYLWVDIVVVYLWEVSLCYDESVPDCVSVCLKVHQGTCLKVHQGTCLKVQYVQYVQCQYVSVELYVQCGCC